MKWRQHFLTVFMAFVTIVTMASFGFCQASDNRSLFYRANLAYKNGHYAEAVKDYEKILSNGFESGALYYNLGNSYYKQGRIGKAILNYERAKRLMPRDGDLKSNHAYAQSLVKLRVKSSVQPFFARTLQTISLKTTPDELAIILLVVYIIGWIVFIVSKILKWPLKRTIIVLSILSVVFFSHMILLFTHVNYYRDLAIVLQETDSKFEPLEDATTHFLLSEGVKVRIIDREGEWVKVKRLDGKVGWVKQRTIERI